MTVTEVVLYETSDGELFRMKARAEAHERELSIIAFVSGIVTQEADQKAIVSFIKENDKALFEFLKVLRA
jgi:hypothetical protein